MKNSGGTAYEQSYESSDNLQDNIQLTARNKVQNVNTDIQIP